MNEERQILTCCDCGTEFRFGIGEQRLFSEHGFEPPKRCRDCRASRRERREALSSDERRALLAWSQRNLATRTTNWR